MARYLCSYIVKVSLDQLHPLVAEILQSCNFEVLYQITDYMMARESKGKIPFPKLVSVEVLIDATTATEEQVQVNFVVKNEELPLQSNNHCKQMFDLIQKTIAKSPQWQLLENISSL
jgi:hypothetical protein